MKYLSFNRLRFCFIIFLLINKALALYENYEPESILKDDKSPITELYENVNSTYMKDFISDLKELVDSYAFSDILKNPPSPYKDIKVDISAKLDEIITDGERPFYDFYRDIKKILSYLRDSAFNIMSGKIPLENSGELINFGDYIFCLPFQFYLDYEQGKEVKMYIKEYTNCSKYYTVEIKEEIKKHEGIAVDKINNIDAFEYIQHFGEEFYKFKNPDSYFSFILNNIHYNNLVLFPLLPNELNSINLAFIDSQNLKTHFHLIKGKNINNNNNINNQELIESINLKNDNINQKIKNLRNYQNNNNNKNNNKNNNIASNNIEDEIEITWNYESEDGKIKCRSDDKNKLNVLFLKSFNTDPKIIFQCVLSFYSNDYKVLIINSQNWEGDISIIYLFTQLLLPKHDIKFNFAMKQTSLNKQNFENHPNNFLNYKTCLPYGNWENFIESTPDDYGDGVKHYRTKIYNPITKTLVEDLRNMREKLLENGDKKPTDILILTDSATFGSSSNFIKTVQNYGGAITANFGGNPKLKKEKILTLDASLDSCDLTTYKCTQFDSDLENNIYFRTELPFAEAFENIKGDKFPNSFKVNKVDEITNIYHSFDDIYYNEFIEAAKKIFDKYNKECNKDNLNLLYESNTCVFPDDEHAHGGFRCNEEGKWGKDCQKSYCDLEYYYDKTTGKCEIDGCSYTEDIIIDEEGEKNYTILPERAYVFKLNTDKYAYFFISDVDNLIHYDNFDTCTKFCAIQNDFEYMYVNYYYILKEKTEIKVISKAMNINIDSYKLISPRFSRIEYMDENIIDIYQLEEDNYMLVESYDKSVKFYYAIYDKDFTVNDLLNMNEKYFKESIDEILYLKKDIIYIFYYKVENIGFCKIYFYNLLPEKINITYDEQTIFYLEPSKTYKLNFTDSTLPFIIRLNEKIDTKIKIVDSSGKEQSLSLSNKYFYPSSQFYYGIIEVTTYNTNAIIEILYSFGEKDTMIINDEINDYNATKEVTLIEYSPKEENKFIQINLKSDYEFSFGAYGGFSKDIYFYYSDYYYPNNYFRVFNYVINLNNPLEEAELEQNEKYYIPLMFTTTQAAQRINISVKYIHNPIEKLYENIDKFYINNVISNLTKILNNYIYLDIIRNIPVSPTTTGWQNINLIEELNKIKSNSFIQFYDFYREIKRILAIPKDINLNILGGSTPKGVEFNNMKACIPFSFYSDKNKNVYINYFSDCAVYFSKKVRKYIKEKEEQKIILETINGENSFNYIENWGKIYKDYKSKDGNFAYIIKNIHSFNLNTYPYKPDELKMIFKFKDDEKTLNLNYFIYIPNIQNKNNLSNKEKINFISQYEQKVKENRIEWDFETQEEKGIKCKVDTLNEINVLIQESFNLDYDKAFDIIYKCTQKFHQNNYQIVVIQNYNGEGNEKLALILRQLLQVKIKNKSYLAYSLLEDLRSDFDDYPESFLDVETCRPFNDFEDFLNGKAVNYSTKDEEIIHEKTKMIDILDKDTRRKLENIRKEFIDTKNLKNPTDIIIFTDSFSSAAASIFIKSFQNDRAAILVGFNSNSDGDNFIPSQSPSISMNFSDSKEFEKLKSLGYEIKGIPVGETYKDDYKKEKPIPLEYTFDKIGHVVNITEPYSEDNYNLFIEEAKKIFKKYNKDGHCKAESNVVLEKDNNCYNFVGDEFAHGGYTCENGVWSTTCKKYYCDLGYYYNTYENKCMRDYCVNDPYEKDILLNDKYEGSIIINKNNNTEYIFEINTEEYIYFFKSNKPGFIHYQVGHSCTSLCVFQKYMPIHKNKLHLNLYRNATDEDVIIQIYSVKNFKGFAESIVFSNKYTVEDLIELNSKFLLISEFSEEYIFYSKTFDNTYQAFYAEYNGNMKINDIIDINKNYFKDCSNKIIEAKPGKIYIFIGFSENQKKPLEILIQPKIINNEIDISSNVNPLALYLSNEKNEYILNFSQNSYDRMIKLSKTITDCEITITNIETGEKVSLNSKNSYYSFVTGSDIFTKKIKININKGNYALIEFLFGLNTNKFEIITEKELTNYRFKKSPIIKFYANTKNKDININLFSQTGKNFIYSYITGYSKNNYVNFPLEFLPEISGKSSYELNIYNKDEILEKDESFYLILYFKSEIFLEDDYEIKLSKKEKEDKITDKPSNSVFNKPKLWLIILFSFLF